MKIECVKEKLLQVMSKVDRITTKNQTLPVLQCVLLLAHNSSLKIRATNLDVGVEFTLPVKVLKEGVVAIPAHILNNTLGVIGDQNITITVDGSILELTSLKHHITLKTQPYEDFPTIPFVVKNKSSLLIKAKDFINGIKSVWYSASISGIKQELSSIFIHYHNNGLHFVATDSFRLAEKQIIIKDQSLKDLEQLLIPQKNIADIIKILDSLEGELEISFTKNQFSIHTNNTSLTSRLIDGTFPDYKQIIPKTSTTQVVVLKQDVLQALKMNTIFSDKFNQINFKIDPKKKVFELRSKNSDIGESVTKIDGALSGEEIEVNFNHKYISDCFQSIVSDSISFEFSGLNKPLVIKGVSDVSFTYIVMPMNK